MAKRNLFAVDSRQEEEEVTKEQRLRNASGLGCKENLECFTIDSDNDMHIKLASGQNIYMTADRLRAMAAVLDSPNDPPDAKAVIREAIRVLEGAFK